MTWSDVTTLYQVLTVAMVVTCVLAYIVNRSALDLFAAGSVVFVFTVMSAMITSAYDPPWSSAHMPPQDLICAWIAWWSARREPQHHWHRWLAIAFTVQCGIHAIYWGAIFLSYALGQDIGLLTRIYPWPVNALFLIELAILSLAGGGYVVGYVRSRLPLLHRSAAPHRSGRA